MYEEELDSLNQSLNTAINFQNSLSALKLAEDDLEFGKEAFTQQLELANQQFDWNKRVADRNYNWQKTQWEYQKQLNELAMQREDTAFQRARSDLEKAGLSPLMLSSGAGAQALNAGTAPQYDYNGVNTAYGAKQDALERRRQQINENRQYRFQQKQANRQLALQSASMALQVEKQTQDLINSIYDNRQKKQQTERLEYENKYYREHGYRDITLATVLSDFLNRADIQKAIDNISNWSAPKILELTEVVPKVLDETKDGFTKEGMSETLQKKSGLSKKEADEYVNLVEKELDEPWYKASWQKIKTTAIIVKDAISEKYNRRYK